MLLNNLTKLLSIEKIDRLVNILIVSPLLHLIQNDWAKFSIVALILGVIIVIKNILMVLVTYSKNKSIKNKSSFVLWKFINSLIVIPISYMQFKYESFTQHNYWIEAITVFYNMLKLSQDSNELNKLTLTDNSNDSNLTNQLSNINSSSTLVPLKKSKQLDKVKIKNKKNHCKSSSSSKSCNSSSSSSSSSSLNSVTITNQCKFSSKSSCSSSSSSSSSSSRSSSSSISSCTVKKTKTKLSKKEVAYFLRTYNIINN